MAASRNKESKNMVGRKKKKDQEPKPNKTLHEMVSERQNGKALGGKKYKVLESTKPLWGIVEFDLNSPVEEEDTDEREEI